MTWIHAASDQNGLALTDGYLRPPASESDVSLLAAHEREQALSDHLCRIANKAVRNYRRDFDADGHTVQTWVFGQDGWLNQELPELIRNVAGTGENSDAYRMILLQFDRSKLKVERHARAGRWLYETGVFDRKKHVADKDYKTAATDFLNELLPVLNAGMGREFFENTQTPYRLGRFARA